MQRKVKVLIVDDQKSIRSLLKTLIGQLGGEVVGEAQDGEEAVTQFATLTPDIVLMDINMPKMDGIEALKHIIASHPQALVIMLTSQNTVEVVQECITHGAKNFLLKSNPVEVLFEELKSTWSAHVTQLQGV